MSEFLDCMTLPGSFKCLGESLLLSRCLFLPLLSASTSNITTDPDFLEFPIPDEFLKPSLIPTFLLSLTNDICHLVVLLELEAKLNTLFLSPVEESVAMIVLLPLLDNDDTTNESSPLQHYLMKYIHIYHKSAFFAFTNTYHCTIIILIETELLLYVCCCNLAISIINWINWYLYQTRHYNRS